MMNGIAGRIVAAAALLCTAIAQAADTAPPFVPVTDAMIQNPDPNDWLSWRRTLDSWGYSPLDQITTANVNQLRMVWVRPLDAGHQVPELRRFEERAGRRLGSLHGRNRQGDLGRGGAGHQQASCNQTEAPRGQALCVQDHVSLSAPGLLSGRMAQNRGWKSNTPSSLNYQV